MFDWNLLLSSALAYGLGLCLVLVTIMIISAAVAPDMWVGDYPPDIRRRYGPMSSRAARLRPLIAVLVFAAALAIPILGLVALQARLDQVPFMVALAFSILVLLVFNTFDLIVLDWLLFCTIQPPFMVLPGTEGMPGYRDYRFHFMGFIKGLGFCAVGGLLIAGAWTLAQWLIR